MQEVKFRVWFDAERRRVRARILPGGRSFPLTRTGEPEALYNLPKVTGIRTWYRPNPWTYGWENGRKVTLWISGYDPAPLLDAVREVAETGGAVTVSCPWREGGPERKG